MVTGAEQGSSKRRVGRYSIGIDSRSMTYVPLLDGRPTSWSRLLVDSPTLAAPFLVFHRVISIGTRAMTPERRLALVGRLIEAAAARPFASLSCRLAPLCAAWRDRSLAGAERR